ncbi:MAG: hypothetical protein AAF632_23205 [Bacteroidota bacterium]
MKVAYYPLLAILAILSIQCSSSKRLLERGNYYEAVMEATDKLRRSPKNRKAQAALRQAYPLAVEQLLSDIDQAKSARAAFQWSIAADSYRSLNTMFDAIKTSPAARRVIAHPKDFHQQYGQVRTKAAEEQYQAAEQAMRENTIESARQAYFHYQQAGQYVANYKDTNQKLTEALEAGTLKVLVEAQPVPSRYYQVSGDFFYDQVDGFLQDYERRNQFIAFYTPQEIHRQGSVAPDHVLQLRFEDFVVGQSHTFQKEETVTADSVKVGEVEVAQQRPKTRTLSRDVTQVSTSGKTVKKPVYGTVSAKLITTRIEITSGGILGVNITDGNGSRSLLREDLRGEHLWFAEWARFQGDERALSEEHLALCNLPEAVPPPPQQLFVEFTKPLYSQLTDQLNRFYQNY